MMLLERWVVAALLGLGLASTAGAPGQSPAGQAQQKQQAQPNPELPPWDSAQPPPSRQSPAPEDPAEPPGGSDPTPPADSAPPPDAAQPAPPAASAQQPAAQLPPPADPPQQQEAARPAPPADPVQPKPAATLPPSTDPAQRQMEKDTAQLLQLVEELKVEVNRAGSNTLSVIAVRKADEIQRLVKSLKDQMKERGQIVVSKP
jgi:hypothetical protein